jgi:hypothetical protein
MEGSGRLEWDWRSAVHRHTDQLRRLDRKLIDDRHETWLKKKNFEHGRENLT